MDLACGGEVTHSSSGTHLTRLAILTDEEAGVPPPGTAPEGVALLIVTKAGNSPVEAVGPPLGGQRYGGAIAVVLSNQEEDADIVGSLGWRVLRLDDTVRLEEAGHRLSLFAKEMVVGVS